MECSKVKLNGLKLTVTTFRVMGCGWKGGRWSWRRWHGGWPPWPVSWIIGVDWRVWRWAGEDSRLLWIVPPMMMKNTGRSWNRQALVPRRHYLSWVVKREGGRILRASFVSARRWTYFLGNFPGNLWFFFFLGEQLRLPNISLKFLSSSLFILLWQI
jgi:hypothetical protein